MNRANLLLLTGLLLTGTLIPAAAQDHTPTPAPGPATVTALPTTSIGDGLNWAVASQTLELEVLQGGPVRLEFYSPAVDPADYRSPSYYGDETYGDPNVTSTFTLTGPDGAVVREARYDPASAAWQSMIDGDLPAGVYRLNVLTRGKGKNTFTARLTSAAAELRAARLTVNVRSNDWTPGVRIQSEGRGLRLRMYDGDGSTELQAALHAPDGTVTPVPVSGDLEWLDLPLPEADGEYVLLLRQPARTVQYSNTVGFELFEGDRTVPLVLARAVVPAPVAGTPTQPEPIQPEPARTEPARTEPVTAPEAAVPAEPVTDAEPAGPAPEVAAPEATTANTAAPGPVSAEPSQPEPTTPEVTAPEATGPEPVPAPQPEPAPAPAPAPTAPAEQHTAPAYTVQRESSIDLPYLAPATATRLTVAHDVVPGAAYVPGSTRLNGQPLADPLVGPSGRLYWTFDATEHGVLTYRVTHQQALGALGAPALLARYPRDRAEVLQGAIDERDLAAARARPVITTENDGPIRLPVQGHVFRDRDRITVVVETLIGATSELTVNGAALPAGALGRTTTDSARGTVRLEYYGVPLSRGENTLQLGEHSVRVYYAAAPAQVRMQPEQLVADGATPIRVRLQSFDAYGNPTAQTFVTVRSTLEPLRPDANTFESGYQIRLTDGEGVLELRPQPLPARLTVDALIGERVFRRTFDVTPDTTRVGVGGASITARLDAPNLAGHAEGYYEGMLGRGKLYAAADTRGLSTTTNPLDRYPLYGDASLEGVPLQGIDPVAFRYEHPDFQLQYRQAPVPIDVFRVGETLTALSGVTRGAERDGAVRASGFAALVPDERVRETLVPDGTRLLYLSRAPVARDSQTLELITRDPLSGRETRRTLIPYVDYTLDDETGAVVFITPVSPVAGHLDPQRIDVTYRTRKPLSNRRAAGGAQVLVATGPLSAAVAGVHLDGITTLGARAAYREGNVAASARAALSGGVQAAADAAWTDSVTDARAAVTYQDATYAGLNPVAPGFSAQATVRRALGSGLGAVLSGEYGSAARTANVSALGTYTLRPWTFGAGLRADLLGTQGVSAVGAAGYHDGPWAVDVAHTQPITGGAHLTQISTAFTVAPNVRLLLRDDIDWRAGQRASVGLESRLGGTNVAVAYDLPTADGSGNRARFGADTALPLNDRLSLGLRGAYAYEITGARAISALGTSLRYSETNVTATLGADFSVAGTLKTVVRAGIAGTVTPDLTVTADALTELGERPGTRLGAGYAYRSADWSSLGYLRYQNGSLSAGADEVLGAISAEHRQPDWAARAGIDLRFAPNDPGSLTWQPSAGGTWYVTDLFGVGLTGRALLQPATGVNWYGLGVEGSVRFLPGAWATLGYNILGFEGLPGTNSRPGAYLRLDLLLDEKGGR